MQKAELIAVLTWAGKFVSKNRMHQPARGRLILTDQYREFLASMTLQWMRRTAEPIEGPFDMYMHACCGPLIDYQNIIDPVCDALEKAGIVKNDRNLGFFIGLPPTRHPKRVEDSLTIWIGRNFESRILDPDQGGWK